MYNLLICVAQDDEELLEKGNVFGNICKTVFPLPLIYAIALIIFIILGSFGGHVVLIDNCREAMKDLRVRDAVFTLRYWCMYVALNYELACFIIYSQASGTRFGYAVEIQFLMQEMITIKDPMEISARKEDLITVVNKARSIHEGLLYGSTTLNLSGNSHSYLCIYS